MTGLSYQKVESPETRIWDRVSAACVRVKPLDIFEEGPQCFNIFNVFLTAMFVEGYFKPKYDLILTQPSGFCG